MIKDTNETIEQTEEDDINHIDPLLSGLEKKEIGIEELNYKIKKSIKKHKRGLENIDSLYRSHIFTHIEIRDKIKETEGKIIALYWVLGELETKTKTSDYKGCNSYITDC